MGLFGYNETDYKKNTAVFKATVNDLLTRFYSLGVADAEAGKAMNTVLALLDDTPYPTDEKGRKVDGKGVKAVDDRIAKLLATMRQDIQAKNAASFSEHAQMLQSAIEDSRQFGQELYSEKDINDQENLADLRGQVANQRAKKAQIAREMQQIERRAERAEETGNEVELEKLEDEYAELEIQQKECDDIIASNNALYEQVRQIVRERKVAAAQKRLQRNQAKVGSLADVAKERMEAAQQRERNNAFVESLSEGHAEFEEGNRETLSAGARSSGLRSKLAAKKSAELQSTLDGASYSGESSEGETGSKRFGNHD